MRFKLSGTKTPISSSSKKDGNDSEKQGKKKRDTPQVVIRERKRFQRPIPPPNAVRIAHSNRAGKKAPPRAGKVFKVIFEDKEAQHEQLIYIQTNSPREARTLSTFVKLDAEYNFKLSTISPSGIALADLPEEEQEMFVNGVAIFPAKASKM